MGRAVSRRVSIRVCREVCGGQGRGLWGSGSGSVVRLVSGFAAGFVTPFVMYFFEKKYVVGESVILFTGG